MITLAEFEKFNLNDKIKRLKLFLDQFNNPKILNLKDLINSNESSITSDVALDIFNIIFEQYENFISQSVSSLQSFIKNIKTLEEGEKVKDNPEELLKLIQ